MKELLSKGKSGLNPVAKDTDSISVSDNKKKITKNDLSSSETISKKVVTKTLPCIPSLHASGEKVWLGPSKEENRTSESFMFTRDELLDARLEHLDVDNLDDIAPSVQRLSVLGKRVLHNRVIEQAVITGTPIHRYLCHKLAGTETPPGLLEQVSSSISNIVNQMLGDRPRFDDARKRELFDAHFSTDDSLERWEVDSETRKYLLDQALNKPENPVVEYLRRINEGSSNSEVENELGQFINDYKIQRARKKFAEAGCYDDDSHFIGPHLIGNDIFCRGPVRVLDNLCESILSEIKEPSIDDKEVEDTWKAILEIDDEEWKYDNRVLYDDIGLTLKRTYDKVGVDVECYPVYKQMVDRLYNRYMEEVKKVPPTHVLEGMIWNDLMIAHHAGKVSDRASDRVDMIQKLVSAVYADVPWSEEDPGMDELCRETRMCSKISDRYEKYLERGEE